MRLKRVITAGLGAAALAAAAVGPALAAPVAGAAPAGKAPAAGATASPFAPGTGQPVVAWNKTLITLQGMPGAQPATRAPDPRLRDLAGRRV